jgi:hypothetical protein
MLGQEETRIIEIALEQESNRLVQILGMGTTLFGKYMLLP